MEYVITVYPDDGSTESLVRIKANSVDDAIENLGKIERYLEKRREADEILKSSPTF